MVFQSKMTPFKRWVEPERIQKYVSFFGPGVDAEVRKLEISVGYVYPSVGVGVRSHAYV